MSPSPSASAPAARRPSDWADLLDERIAAGAWTEDEGVVRLLQAFTGDGQAIQTGDTGPPIRASGSGVMRRARGLLASQPSTPRAGEIRALLDRLLPSRAALEGVSRPASQARLAMAAPDRIAELPPACEGAEPPPGIEDPGICLLYDERTTGGTSVRLYYPRVWHADLGRGPFFDLILGAAVHSVDVFRRHGLEVGAWVDIVITEFPDPDPIEFLGDAEGIDEGCQARVFPTVLEAWRGEPGRGDRIRQLLAHELFHCFQHWNLEDAYAAPSGVSDWWREGSAEFFSNVAYPAANAEHDWIEEVEDIPDPGLFARDYGNVFFFQHLANSEGIPAVLSLLRSVPASNDAGAHAAAVASFPDMEAIFHSYGEALLTPSLDDLGRGPFPINTRIDTFEVAGPTGITAFDITPFAVHRYGVEFAEGLSYTIESRLVGDARQTARQTGSRGWSGPPATVAAGCEIVRWVWVVTSVASGAAHESEVTEANESLCDQCLVGTWDLENSTYEDFVPRNPALTFEGVSGRMYLAYEAGGTFAGGFDRFAVAFSQETSGIDGNPVTQTVELVMHGRADGTYAAGAGVVRTLQSDYDFGATVRIIYGGELLSQTSVPFQDRSLPIVFGEPLTYTCTETELRFTSVIGERDLTPLVFRRSSVPLPGPSPSAP